MTTAIEQLRYELGRRYEYRRTLDERMRCARAGERAAIAAEGDRIDRRVAELRQLAGARDAWIFTPGAIRAEQDTVLALVQQLDTDIQGAKVRPEFKRAWDVFREEYKRFYDESGWWSRWWFVAYEKTLEYRRRIIQWRQAFEAEGGHASGPTPAASPGTTDSHLGTYLALAGGAFAVAVLWRFVSSPSKPEHAPERRAAS